MDERAPKDSEVDQAAALSMQGWPKAVIEKFLGHLDLAKGPVISVDNLIKSFGAQHVLQGFTLNVFSGEIVGLVGVSGSGKTTLLETMAGVLRPDKGSVKIKDPHSGEMVTLHKTPMLRWWVGFSPQVPSIFPELTVKENLQSVGELLEMPFSRVSERINELSIMFGLAKMLDVQVAHLSRGWQKKVDIAVSVIHEPPVLMLDEPGRDLDPISRKEVYHCLKKLQERGTTIVLSSHNINELSGLCTRIGVLHQGCLFKSVRPTEVAQAGYEIILKTDRGVYEPYMERLAQAGVSAIASRQGLRLQTSEPELVVRFLLDSTQGLHEKILDLQVNRPDVGSLFEGLVRS